MSRYLPGRLHRRDKGAKDVIKPTMKIEILGYLSEKSSSRI